jgi:adenylylsulfate kinase
MVPGKFRESRGVTVWFTGLPCSGKTAVADRVAEMLRARGYRVERLDGDIVRQSLTRDLGYSREDRNENIRRVTFVAKLLTRNGVIVLTSFISPYRDIRAYARQEIGEFIEVYTKCPLEVCIQRDVKGMYQKALRGEIKEFTGISDPYEEPLNPELVLETDRESLEESVGKVIAKLKELGYIDNSEED